MARDSGAQGVAQACGGMGQSARGKREPHVLQRTLLAGALTGLHGQVVGVSMEGRGKAVRVA